MHDVLSRYLPGGLAKWTMRAPSERGYRRSSEVCTPPTPICGQPRHRRVAARCAVGIVPRSSHRNLRARTTAEGKLPCSGRTCGRVHGGTIFGIGRDVCLYFYSRLSRISLTDAPGTPTSAPGADTRRSHLVSVSAPAKAVSGSPEGRYRG